MLSVLLLPGGGGEDDIDIGGGVLSLGGGGVAGPGHGGGVVPVVCPLVILARVQFVPTCHQGLHAMCKSQTEQNKSSIFSHNIITNIHL